MGGDDTATAGNRRYPRICGECGIAFVASRRDARWCSSPCRLRAWRHRQRIGKTPADCKDHEQLVGRIDSLQAALEQAHAANVCAQQGCQLGAVAHTAQARNEVEYAGRVTPWRTAEWQEPTARLLRAKLTQQADELDRLRQENGLLRRWVSDHFDVGGRPRGRQ